MTDPYSLFYYQSLVLRQCNICGALVSNERMHTAWHPEETDPEAHALADAAARRLADAVLSKHDPERIEELRIAYGRAFSEETRAWLELQEGLR